MNLIQKSCEKITKHRIRKLYALNERETEFYYRCKICGFRFWNRGGKVDMEQILNKWDYNKKCYEGCKIPGNWNVKVFSDNEVKSNGRRNKTM